MYIYIIYMLFVDVVYIKIERSAWFNPTGIYKYLRK